MSLKNLFQVKKVLPPATIEQINEEVESVQLLDSYTTEKDKVQFAVDYSDPANFSIFGSARKYYVDTIQRIYQQYPYDGSRKEKIDWYNSSSLLDIYFYENLYPRTTGYATFSSNGWSTPIGTQISGYGEPTTKEYITIKGGPNTNSATTLKDKFNDFSNQQPKSNVYNAEDNRSTNLYINGANGNTIEFWLKKDSFVSSSTSKEVVFDLWNNVASSSSGYGRLTIELSASTGSPFYLTLKSGSNGFNNLNIGSSLTTSSVANGDWNHYAISFINNSSNIDVNFYVNDVLNYSTTTGTAIGAINGSLLANIGSLKTAPSGVTGVGLGWGKLSGSIDEFRFWKSQRTNREIGRNWWTTVGGGTNTDIANTDLGFYYKFNEGNTTDNTIDSIVLDYSGRICNGTWVGYSATSRNTGSAINEYTNKTLSREEPDPIIYATHPDVLEAIQLYTNVGTQYDNQNPNSIYYSFPNWIIEEDNDGNLLNVTQIAASYLDTLYLQIKNFTSLKDHYSNIQIDEKPFPFSKNILESMGIVAPSLFIDAKLMEEVLSKDEERTYEDKLNEVKNIIYQNIYSNLQNIFKSKGTEKSFRNLLHCFGVDEELVKLNIYSNNDSHTVQDNKSNITIKKKSVNFNDPDRFYSTIYQYKDPSNTASISYISGATSTELNYVPYTFETEAVFPKKLPIEHPNYFVTDFITSSLFGGHTAKSNPDDYTFDTPDYFSFNVYSIRKEKESPDVRFCLSVPYYSINLTSSLFADVYNNEKWNFAVRVKPNKLENVNLPLSSADTLYTIELYGVNVDGGVVKNEFTLSSSLSNTNGLNFVKSAKRLFVGAERTNFTGSVVNQTDVKVLNFRVWSNYLSNNDITTHAYDPTNYGITSVLENSYLKQSAFSNNIIPKLDTLLLDWQFDLITGSNSGSGSPNVNDAYFLVEDSTSGSVEYNKYNLTFNNLKKYQYTGKADFLPQNDTTLIDTQYLFSSKNNHFENIRNSDLVNILEAEEEVLFTREIRPITYFFSFEKSMYNTISEQMLNMFGTILDFNNLVGEPVNKYRKEYKSLGKLRQMFFEKVQNTPDLDKYLDFYKWIDSAVGKFVLQLVPASADSSEGLLNVVESHALERNKHQYKFPTAEFKDPNLESGFIGINKHLYDWKNGYRPLSNQENENCLYWSDKAERNVAPLDNLDSGIDNTRTKVFEAKTQVLNRSYTTPLRLNVIESKTIKGGVNFETNKNLDYVKIATEPHGPLDSDDVIQPPANYLFTGIELTSSIAVDCSDEVVPTKKKKYYFSTVHGRDYNSTQTKTYSHVVSSKIALPANLISASLNGGYHDFVNSQFVNGIDITNIHNDTYGSSNEVPIQGPFTNQWVGGNQSRHITLNTGNDSYLTRPEAWKITLGVLTGSEFTVAPYQTAIGWIGADYPYPEGNDFEPSYPVVAHKRATYFRDETAKRPVNIRNIRSSTGSIDLGNFEKNYQVVQTMGRTTNNKVLVDQVTPITSSELYGIVRTSVTSPRTDFTLVERPRTETVIGSRFSAPGDSRTLSRGFLNAYAEELSPYNAMSFRNRQVIGDGRRTADALTNDIERYNNTVSGAVGKSLTALLAKPTSVGGYESGSTTIASLHKVNRNTLYTIDHSGSGTSVVADYDNGFVTHQIPQNDAGYSWIRAAISGTANDRNPAYFGHILTNYTVPSGTTSTTQSLSIISASEFASVEGVSGSYAFGYDIKSVTTPYIPTDFAGLNTNIRESSSYTQLNGSSNYLDLLGGLITTTNSGSSALTLSSLDTTFSISSVTGTVGPVEMVFGNNGSNLFVLSYDGVGGANYGYIVSYSLSTPYDIDTITSSKRAIFNLGGVTALNGLAFNNDGTKLYVVSNTDGYIYQYSITAWDISTLNVLSYSRQYFGSYGRITSIFWKDDGTKLFLTTSDTKIIYQFNFSVAFSITSVSSSGTAKSLSSIGGISTRPEGVWLDSTGTYMFIGSGNPTSTSSSPCTVYKFKLSTAWDSSTAVYTNQSVIITDIGNSDGLTGMWVKDNSISTKLYAISRIPSRTIYQYNFTFSDSLESVSDATPSFFNALMHHRGNSYGYSSFKQIRNNNHLVVRNQIKDNYISTITSQDNLLLKKEPALYFNKPNEFYIKNKETEQIFEAIFAYENLLQSFEDEELFNNLATLKNKTFYEKTIYTLKNTSKYNFSKFVHKTSIYPKKKLATLKENKTRLYYSFTAWRNERNNRTRTNSITDFTYGNLETTVPLQSMWPMDGRQIQITGVIPSNYLYNIAESGTIGAEGILQNKQTIVYSGTLSSSIISSPLYSLPHLANDGGFGHYNRNSFKEADYTYISGNSIIDETYKAQWNTSGGYFNHFRGIEFIGDVTGSLSLTSSNPDVSIPWETNLNTSGSNGPYYDTYQDWFEELRAQDPSYTILPEYTISDDDKIIEILAGKLSSPTANYLRLDGAVIEDSLGSNKTEFFNKYVDSENIFNIDTIKQDLEPYTKSITLTLDCDAFIKFNPKPELYPQIRTVKIAEKFVNSTLPYISFWKTDSEKVFNYSNSEDYKYALRNFMVPLFSPGILYNTIKAGVAVDFPIFTSSVTHSLYPSILNLSSSVTGSSYGILNSFDVRIPFEALLEPEQYIDQLTDIIPPISNSSGLKTNLNITSSWTGQYDNATYKLSISNFLAETVDFFSPEGKLTTLFSATENKFKRVDANKKYRALIKIYKSAINNNVGDYLNATSSVQSTLYVRPQYTNKAIETITMYSRPSSFGPQCAMISSGSVYGPRRGPEFNYAPFTPPYYDGSAWALLTYTPQGTGSYVPTLDEIQNNLEIKYLRIEETLSGTSDTHMILTGAVSHINNSINKNAMQLSASITIDNFLSTQELSLNFQDSIKTETPTKVWAIQSKFETPILNFQPDVTGYTPSLMESQMVKTYGMWHQYGTVPEIGKGIYLQVSDIPSSYVKYGSEESWKNTSDTSIKGDENFTGSLADIVGFSTEPVKLGQITGLKEIKEAVLAIPYIEQKGERKFFKLNDNTIKYIQKQYFGNSKDIEKISENNSLSISEVVRTQIQSLEEYVIPPRFDFLNNIEVEPISMYVFEFKYTLSQKDLADIWQGVQPQIATRFEKQKISISHELNSNEFIDTKSLSENLKWLVFKVKKKAKTNYFNKVLQSQQETQKRRKDNLLKLGRTKINNLGQDNELIYSYNWPYDYFSLVELAKINATVEFDSNDKQVVNVSTQTQDSLGKPEEQVVDNVIVDESEVSTATTPEGGAAVQVNVGVNVGANAGDITGGNVGSSNTQQTNTNNQTVATTQVSTLIDVDFVANKVEELLTDSNVSNTNTGGNRPNNGGRKPYSGKKPVKDGTVVEVDTGIGGGSVGGRGAAQVTGGTRNPFSVGIGEGVTSGNNRGNRGGRGSGGGSVGGGGPNGGRAR
jgi:hypothetical protein